MVVLENVELEKAMTRAPTYQTREVGCISTGMRKKSMIVAMRNRELSTGSDAFPFKRLGPGFLF